MMLSKRAIVRIGGILTLLFLGTIGFLNLPSNLDRDDRLIATKAFWERHAEPTSLRAQWELLRLRWAKHSPIVNVVGNPTHERTASSVFETLHQISGQRYFVDRDVNGGMLQLHETLAPLFAKTNVVSARAWMDRVTNALANGEVQVKWFEKASGTYRGSRVMLLKMEDGIVVVPPERVRDYAGKKSD